MGSIVSCWLEDIGAKNCWTRSRGLIGLGERWGLVSDSVNCVWSEEIQIGLQDHQHQSQMRNERSDEWEAS